MASSRAHPSANAIAANPDVANPIRTRVLIPGAERYSKRMDGLDGDVSNASERLLVSIAMTNAVAPTMRFIAAANLIVEAKPNAGTRR